jgi:hypothetical protein
MLVLQLADVRMRYLQDIRRKEYVRTRLLQAVWSLERDSSLLGEVLIEILEMIEGVS